MQTPYSSCCAMLGVPSYKSRFHVHVVGEARAVFRLRHLSLGPCSVFLDPSSNEMQMGDFLGRWTAIRDLGKFHHDLTSRPKRIDDGE